MKCFEHNGNTFISINGKDYFLLRGHKNDSGKFIFVQVSGNTPLRKEDMPTKDWEIIRTKQGDQKVWTGYKKAYFRYDTEKECPELAFIGATTKGSYFLALRWLAQKYNQNIPDERLHHRAIQLKNSNSYSRDLSTCHDMGNSGESAVMIRISYVFDEGDAIEILKGEQT